MRVRHTCVTRDSASGARLEAEKRGLEVRRKDATGGSGRPLLPCFLASSTAAGNPNTPAARRDPLPFVSRAPHLRAEALQVPSPNREPRLRVHRSRPSSPPSRCFLCLRSLGRAGRGRPWQRHVDDDHTNVRSLRTPTLFFSNVLQPKQGLGNRRHRSVAWCQPGGVGGGGDQDASSGSCLGWGSQPAAL